MKNMTITPEQYFKYYQKLLPPTVFSEKEKNIILKTIEFKDFGKFMVFYRNLPSINKKGVNKAILSLEKIISSFKYTMNFNKKNDIYKMLGVKENKEYKIKISNVFHMETPNMFAVYNSKNEIVCTFNFHFVYDNNKRKPTVHFNNIQAGFYGINNRKNRKEILKETSAKLEKLNNFFGENWRVYITKKIYEFFNKNKFEFKAQLPQDFFTTTKKEHLRLVRQYLQTYIKAGVPLRKIDASKISEEIKERIENNIKNKMLKNKIKKQKIIKKHHKK